MAGSHQGALVTPPIKDRPARAMIEAAEADDRLKPGGTIVEATAGNTGLGLALVGGRKGYRIVLVVALQDGARENSSLQGGWAPKWC